MRHCGTAHLTHVPAKVEGAVEVRVGHRRSIIGRIQDEGQAGSAADINRFIVDHLTW